MTCARCRGADGSESGRRGSPQGTRGGANPLNYAGYGEADNNRLTNVTGGLTRSYSYNAKGQVTGDGTRSFVWNGANRITSIAGVATYAYDALGKRIKTTKLSSGEVEYTIYSSAGTLLYSHKPGTGESTDYLYLGSMPLAELRTVPGVMTPPPPAENPAQDVVVQLTSGLPPQLVQSGTPNAQATTTYLHTNLLGSPVQWSGSGGAWMANEHYEAYGHKMNGAADKLGYTGHAHDFESDLTYMQARFYDSQVGRFLSADPVEFDGSTPFDFNRYVYANNNPYRYIDPMGMTAYDCSGGAGTGNCDAGAQLQEGDTVTVGDTVISVNDISGNNMSLTRTRFAYSGTSDTAGDLTVAQRQKGFDRAKASLIKDGILTNQEVQFEPKFAIGRKAANGSLDLSSIQLFDSWGEAVLAMLSSGKVSVAGHAEVGGNQIQIYGQAIGSRVVVGCGNRCGTFRMSRLQYSRFVITHEVAHTTGILNEFAADRWALRKLGY